MVNVIIIDDERLARNNIKAILSRFFPELNMVGEASSVTTGKALIANTDFDLLFLDIDLSDGSGFNLIENIESPTFPVIFTTAYNEFAVRAFEVNAIDYILKPLSKKDLGRAIKKAKKQIAQTKEKTLKEQKQSVKISINEGHTIRFLDIADILRCESDNNYTEVFLRNGDRIVSFKTLKEYTETLEPYGFLRIHQSHLVNLNEVQKLIKKDGVRVQLINGVQIDVSRRKKNCLYEALNKLQTRTF